MIQSLSVISTAVLLGGVLFLLRSLFLAELHEDRRLEMWRGLGLQTYAEMKALVDEGVSVNDRGVEGQTLLMVAAEFGQEEAVRTLLGLGADLDAKDEKGRTALMLARTSGQSAVVRLLRKAAQENNPDGAAPPRGVGAK